MSFTVELYWQQCKERTESREICHSFQRHKDVHRRELRGGDDVGLVGMRFVGQVDEVNDLVREVDQFAIKPGEDRG